MSDVKLLEKDKLWKIDNECYIHETIDYNTRVYILQRDKYTCRYCLTKKPPFEVDHIYPKSKGGSGKENNLACACKKCNQKKHNKTLKELKWKLYTII